MVVQSRSELLAICLALFALHAGCRSSTDDLVQSPRVESAVEPIPELRLGSDVWPPFTNYADKPRVAIELVHRALKRTGVDAVTRIQTGFDEITHRLERGELDGSPAIWRSPDRERYLLYSKPYLENRLILVGKQGSDLSARVWSDLKWKRVAIVEGYAYGSELETAGDPVFVAGRSVSENLQKLLLDEVDYVLAEELLVSNLFRQNSRARELLAAGRTPLLTRRLHFAVRKDYPSAQDIIDRFNGEILRMVYDGSFNRILRVDWLRADIDGDGSSELILRGKRAGIRPPDDSYDLFASPGPRGEADDKESGKFVIEGETYTGWESIPEEYKASRSADETPGWILFEF